MIDKLYSELADILDHELKDHHNLVDYVHEAEKIADSYINELEINFGQELYLEYPVHVGLFLKILNDEEKTKLKAKDVEMKIIEEEKWQKEFKDRFAVVLKRERPQMTEQDIYNFLNEEMDALLLKKDWPQELENISGPDFYEIVNDWGLKLKKIMESVNEKDAIITKSLTGMVKKYLKTAGKEIKAETWDELVKEIEETGGIENLQHDLEGNLDTLAKDLVHNMRLLQKSPGGKNVLKACAKALNKKAKDIDQGINNAASSIGLGVVGNISAMLGKQGKALGPGKGGKNIKIQNGIRATLLYICVDVFISTLGSFETGLSEFDKGVEAAQKGVRDYGDAKDKTTKQETYKNDMMTAIVQDLKNRDQEPYQEGLISSLVMGVAGKATQWAKVIKQSKSQVFEIGPIVKDGVTYGNYLMNVMKQSAGTVSNLIGNLMQSGITTGYLELPEILQNLSSGAARKSLDNAAMNADKIVKTKISAKKVQKVCEKILKSMGLKPSRGAKMGAAFAKGVDAAKNVGQSDKNVLAGETDATNTATPSTGASPSSGKGKNLKGPLDNPLFTKVKA